jgi:hypothetical protein
MRHQITSGLTLVAAAAAFACSGDPGTTAPAPPIPVAPATLLKEIVIPNLPSPYYHFEYDTSGRVRVASFASGFAMYDVMYDGGRISEMANNTAGNRDRLQYSYDQPGRVGAIRYVDSKGLVYAMISFTYDGQHLAGMERKRRINSDFIIEKTMSFSYHADGNLRELVEHRPLIAGRQDETTTIDRFEEYDSMINVDGFDLLHNEFFDHLVLLPGVQLQKGNPGREIFTGDGANYGVNYTYTYDESHRPLTKNGDLVFTTGQDTGRRFQTHSVFSYY